jgi:hypothetical protein
MIISLINGVQIKILSKHPLISRKENITMRVLLNMKKKISIIILSVFLMICFAGCGSEEDTSFSGAYNGSTVDVLGEATPVAEVFPNGDTSVILNEDYTGIITVDGTSFDITFTLDGENITISAVNGEEGVVCNGTLANNVLEFDFFNLGFNMTFTR